MLGSKKRTVFLVHTKGGFFPTGYFKIVDKNSQLAIDTIFLNCLYLIQMIMIFNIIKIINELVKKTSAYKNNKIVYLDADSWYLSGGGLKSLKSMAKEVEEAL